MHTSSRCLRSSQIIPPHQTTIRHVLKIMYSQPNNKTATAIIFVVPIKIWASLLSLGFSITVFTESIKNFGKYILLVFGLYFASFFGHALNSYPTTNLYIFKWAVFVTPELRYWYILFFHEIESIYSWIIICNLKIYACWNPSRNALKMRNWYRIMKFRYKR